jgi:subtilisin family serine protease
MKNKKKSQCFLSFFIIAFFFNVIDIYTATSSKSNQSCIPGQLIIKLSKTIPTNQVLSENFRHQYSTYIDNISFNEETGYYIFTLINPNQQTQLKNLLKKDSRIADVSLNYLATVQSGTEAPNDPYFKYQYALFNSGQLVFPAESIIGKPGSDIKALAGWDFSKGSEEITIALIDTGVADNHEDLLEKIVPGFNFVNDNYNTYDDHGHGTFVASLIAANANNLKGISGLVWNTRLIPVKVINHEGIGSYLQIAMGIIYAANQGAHIINISIAGETESFILKDACKYAFEKGCILIAAAGNQSQPYVMFPAAYSEYCIAVGATTCTDERAQFSNYGPELSVVAPGEYIIGAWFDVQHPDRLNKYKWDWGTSYAAAYVSGAAALLLSNKSMITNTLFQKLIKYAADDINAEKYPGFDQYTGYGRINLKKLLEPYTLE